MFRASGTRLPVLRPGFAGGQPQVTTAVARGAPVGRKVKSADYVAFDQAAGALAVDFVATAMGTGALFVRRAKPVGCW